LKPRNDVDSERQEIALDALWKILGPALFHPDLMWITESPYLKGDRTIDKISEYKRQAQIEAFQEQEKAE
jgi:hypothetical protein